MGSEEFVEKIISGELNLAELVGKNIEGDSENYRRAILKMREVKL